MPQWRSNRASMLVVVIMVTLVLLMLVMVVGSNTLVNMRATSAVTDKREARYAAYAGLQRAMVELRKSPEWTEGFTDVPMPGKTNLCYTVVVKNNILGTLDQTGIPAAQQVPPKAVKLDAVAGDREDSTKPMRAVTGLSGLAVPAPGMFQQAALGDSLVAMSSGAKTEAFDFTAWTGQDRLDDVHDANKGWIDETINIAQCPERGKVHSNRVMTVADGAQVDGDVTLPYQNEDNETGLEQGEEYTGNQTILSSMSTLPGFSAPIDPGLATAALTDFPPTVIDDGKGKGKDKGDEEATVTTTPFVLAEGAYRSIDVPATQQVKLTTGTYYFKERLNVEGEILIDASGGPVLVYVGEKMIVGSTGRINENGKPRDLQVYFTDEAINPEYEAGANPRPTPPPSGSPRSIDLDTVEKKMFSTFDMQSGSRATMVAAGKHTKANLSGSRLMGSLVADYMNLVGAKIQYDKDLKSQNFFASCPWNLHGVHERAVKR